MKSTPVPTSPKFVADAKANDAAMAKIWQESHVTPPVKSNAGRFVLAAVILSLVLTAGGLFGILWYARQAPQSWLATWLPNTTTVVQSSRSTNSNEIPTAVQKTLATLYGLTQKSASDIYTTATVQGQAVPLSSNGWLLTLKDALPTGDVVALPTLGQPVAATKRVDDPASPFAFVKIAEAKEAPANFKSLESWRGNQPVWVLSQIVHQPVAVARQLVSRSGPTWLSADHQEEYFVLDSPVSNGAGSAVVTSDGRLVGLLDAQQRVWPVDHFEKILSSLIQNGTLRRPLFGIRYLNRAEAIVGEDLSAAGWLVGADSGQSAVVEDSPADKGGILSGDIIESIDGHPVGRSFFEILEKYAVDDTVTLSINRDGAKKSVVITLTVLQP